MIEPTSLTSAAEPNENRENINMEAGARVYDEARTSGGLDLKLLDRPSKFSGKHEDWILWKFQFLNWLAVADSRFVSGMEEAEQSSDPVQVIDGDWRRLQVVLYSTLCSFLQGRCLTGVQ